MSRTYELGCHDCKVTLWVGQGWPSKRVYLYDGEENIRRLQEFFWEHLGHHLEYQDGEHACVYWDDIGEPYRELYGDDENGKPPVDPPSELLKAHKELEAARAEIVRLRGVLKNVIWVFGGKTNAEAIENLRSYVLGVLEELPQ